MLEDYVEIARLGKEHNISLRSFQCSVSMESSRSMTSISWL